MFRTSRDDKLIRIGRRKLNGIAYLVTPQTTIGGNNHRVVLARLYTPDGNDIASIHRDKLIEHIIIEHK